MFINFIDIGKIDSLHRNITMKEPEFYLYSITLPGYRKKSINTLWIDNYYKHVNAI